MQYWVKHAFDLGFQNQKLAFIVSGSNFVLNGEDKGGIDGSGQAWYDYARGVGNVYGRPMSLALIGVKDAVVTNWTIKQPQFWAHILIDSENVVYESCTVNATSTSGPFEEKSWLQNTDGIDTYRSNNVAINNFVYQGGDDCIAFKPNSTNIAVNNVTCVGGTGIAFGSIAQYEGVVSLRLERRADAIRKTLLRTSHSTTSHSTPQTSAAGTRAFTSSRGSARRSGTPRTAAAAGTATAAT